MPRTGHRAKSRSTGLPSSRVSYALDTVAFLHVDQVDPLSVGRQRLFAAMREKTGRDFSLVAVDGELLAACFEVPEDDLIAALSREDRFSVAAHHDHHNGVRVKAEVSAFRELAAWRHAPKLNTAVTASAEQGAAVGRKRQARHLAQGVHPLVPIDPAPPGRRRRFRSLMSIVPAARKRPSGEKAIALRPNPSTR